MKILDAVQECSGLRVYIEQGPCVPLCGAGKAYGRFVKPWQHDPRCRARPKWLNPPEGLSVEEAERLIEEQGIRVEGRL